MKKSKVRTSGLIIKVDDKTSIFADRDQYIVQRNQRNSYFGSLEHCFNAIFQDKVKDSLIDNPEKSIKRIIEIHKETAKWLEDVFRRIENPSI